MDKSKEKEEQSIMDKSMRSVFVGNIPYEATEEKLKDIFSEVGPVLSFKLVFDRETGKPKGYGFCEYKDQETALSAMRNLNGYEIGGRSLRVDNACTEKSRMEMQALMQGPQVENPYGDPVDPEKAPEAISKAVATLPPEQMFELMKQMKLCIQNNPTEARNMLLQNPQLAYALLQAQVIMRIVDPITAVSMLHPSNAVPPVLQPGDKPPVSNVYMPNPPPPVQQPPLLANPPPTQNQYVPRPPQQMDTDLRNSRPPLLDQDMRSLHHTAPPPVHPPVQDKPPLDVNDNSFPRDPRLASMPFNSDPRVRSDPRTQTKMPPQMPPGMPSMAQARTIQGIPSGASDQEKAALIMQVLQLSDEQIALLPPEQRASILMLKEQIAKSTQQR
ncbi:cleavage stimulation factor subunit 2 isoform X1 [Danaus plexippus]|uniref:cleavage stimulation factor subunit 2 isoform X1 n=1 Tax=Danaus plexippus TaxID=13037 RepID=UPI0013C4007B|nr:cleavage stimulation factor subunit 2 isoform X1 [Danaus plexippus plexippus]XP_032515613.1 cleavage stimulation factor subunit 2 isoform X1 [Danaus plexippus]